MTTELKDRKYRVTRSSSATVNGKEVAGSFVTVNVLETVLGDPRSRNSQRRRDRIVPKPVAHFYTEKGVRSWLKEQGIDGRRVTWKL